jgi:2-polyprenyl-3-methyl-5-hydroxy-6-metoxy-1,4-benzoquinol methylase
MKEIQKDYFAQKASEYDSVSARTNNVKNIAKMILDEIRFDRNARVMDFGSGTGLLLTHIAPFVHKITAVDISPSMNEVLTSKKDQIDCELEIVELDLTKGALEQKFDSIVSSMTMHHIQNVQSILDRFYSLLEPGGTIAIADLDKEDGTFHAEDTGVFHLGFERNEMVEMAESAGFKQVKIQKASDAVKPHGTYSIFLLTGRKL